MRAYQKPGRAPCAVNGCGKPLYARTYCTMHYTRVMKGQPLGAPAALRRPPGAGSVIADGYVVLTGTDHPLAGAQGKVRRNRVVLFEKLGAGEHPCHWCGVVLPWQGRPSQQINADHLDGVRTNDVPENLVPACLRCNTQRVRRQAVSA